MNQYHNRFLSSFKNFYYIKQVTSILEYQSNAKELSLYNLFKIHPNKLVNLTLYLISPLVIILVSLYKFVIALLHVPHINNENFSGKRLFLNNNKNFYPRVKDKLNSDDVILRFQTPLKVDGFRNIEITEFVSLPQTFLAFKLSVQSIWLLIKRHDYWACIYALNSFDCYMLMIALDNISKEAILITDSQIDRLAYILDSTKQIHKEIIMHGSTFIHGTPIKNLLSYVIYNNHAIEWCYNMPERLKNISKVYAFSQKEFNYLKLSAMHAEVNPIIVEVGYGTKFSKISNSVDKLDILFVANDAALANDIRLCHFLSKNGYNVFLQIHPLSDASKYKHLINKGIVEIIKDDQRNPLVDVVISYGSTLAHEYEAIGIPVIYYTDYMESNDLNEIELIKVINKYKDIKLNTNYRE